MPSLYEILKTATTALKKVAVSSPDLDARLLLEDVLQKDKSFVLLHPHYVLTDSEENLYESYVKRRLQREPVSKILGIKEFWSLPFKTTKDTLDPRPDSETLIEAVLEQFSDTSKPYKLLDLGTGTGCLLLALLSEYKKATGVGVDFSSKALTVATHNAISLNMETRAKFLQSNWCEHLNGQFDIIISNPPYIPPSHEKTIEPELSFDPKEALYGDSCDGLEAYRLLSLQLKKHLRPQGKIFFEFGKDQHADVEKIMTAANFSPKKYYKDLNQISRCGVFHDL
ncbi:MAG: peptide chain release factor N(5)-glutamine methyltransferase [Alphaproteobacteria bacterium]|nr:peptide chain release factor N(5)-glutamine methyltransferase [Alphaproteobacteria bacterium]